MTERKNFISIKIKLLGIILPVIIIIIIVLTGLSYFAAKNVIKSNAHNLLNASIESQAAQIEAWLNKNLSSFQVAKQTLEQMDFDDKQLQNFLDAYYGYDSDYPEGLYMADTKGTIYKANQQKNDNLEKQDIDGNYIDNGADVTQTEWFLDGLTRVNMGFTNAYTNENGRQVVSACGMLKTDSDAVYVLSADLSLDKISVYVNSFVKMQDAESLLVNAEDYTILAARDTGLISEKLSGIDDGFMSGIAEKISQNKFDLVEMDGNIAVFDKVQGTEWVLVSYVPIKTVYHDLDRIRNIMLSFGIVSILILIVLIERIVHIVINPVKELTSVIKIMTNGDFTTYHAAKSNDEIGVMSQCVEKFIITMRGMIASIDNVSHTLNSQADNSMDVSDRMFDASKQQNQSMKELNATVEQLTVSVNGIAQGATTLASLVSETKEDGDHVNGRMKETVDLSQNGKEIMQGVDKAMQNINSSVSQLQRAINKVGNASGEITNITKEIGEIADETNLLSLNASIEAARAGEAGKGFAVVAVQIGKLAQISMESVKHIDALVIEIKELIGEVVRQAGESMDDISSSSVLIGNAVKTYDNIFDNIMLVGNLVHQMIEKVGQVEDVAKDVAAISEEQAAGSQEILASSDILVEQANSLMVNSETVAKGSEELTTSAEALESQIKIFRV